MDHLIMLFELTIGIVVAVISLFVLIEVWMELRTSNALATSGGGIRKRKPRQLFEKPDPNVHYYNAPSSGLGKRKPRDDKKEVTQ